MGSIQKKSKNLLTLSLETIHTGIVRFLREGMKFSPTEGRLFLLNTLKQFTLELRCFLMTYNERNCRHPVRLSPL